MIEFEKKLLLSKKEYEALLRHYGEIAPTTTQVNHYYDTDHWSMNKEGVTCRIRYRNGQFKATMKVHSPLPCDSSMEMEMGMGNGLDKNDFTDMGLRYQGALVTRRTTVFKNEMCKLMLDMNQYLGETDYELEVEYKEGHAYGAFALLHEIERFLREKCENGSFESFEDRMKHSKRKTQRFFERKESVCLLLCTDYLI